MKIPPTCVALLVRHHQALSYERLGWLNTGPAPGPHEHWSFVMAWLCECPMPRPVMKGRP